MNNSDEFDAAFAEAISVDEPADTTVTPVEVPAPVVEPVAEVTPVETKVEPEAVVAPVVEPVAEVTPVETKVEPAPVEVKTIPVLIPEPIKSEPVAEPVFEMPKLSDDEQKAYEQFKKDWPDIAAAQEAALKHALAEQMVAVRKELFQTTKQVYSDIAPIAAGYAQTAEEKHWSEIRGGHKDIDTVIPELKPWIEAQPGYLRDGMERVYSSGTAKEIVDLVSRFKKEANIVEPQVPDPKPQPKPEPVDASAVAALAPVSGKRSVVATKGADPDDYKGAFAEAVRQG